MICQPCKDAGEYSRAIVQATADGMEVPMGSLGGTMRIHKQCPGGTWCDCQHKKPLPKPKRNNS